MSQHTGSIPVEDVHLWKADATQRLLGHTIGISDREWHAPSQLPGWTRAHIATHLARGADRQREVLEAAVAGRPVPPAAPAERRRADLEAGADRSGLELQIDLDTSAGTLQGAIDRVSEWDAPITLLGRATTLAAVPLWRLHEVCLHHLDLDPGFSPDAVDPAAATWLLRGVLDLLEDADLPALTIDSGDTSATLGRGGERRQVSGTAARLWAWLSGRLPADGVTGADGLQPALLA